MDVANVLGSSYVSTADNNTEKPGDKAKNWKLLAARGAGFSGGNIQAQAIITTAPLTATSPGTPGQIAYSGGYAYLCTSTNVWRRFQTTSF